MYSPKIAEDLIPLLYRLAKARKMRMTKLVDEILRGAVREEAGNDVPPISPPADGTQEEGALLPLFLSVLGLWGKEFFLFVGRTRDFFDPLNLS